MFKKILIIVSIVILSAVTVFVSYGIYYTNNVYDLFGKTSWNYQNDGDKGREVVEKYFLRKKLPSNAEDLKYQISGYCGLDCFAIFSVKVDLDFFQTLA